MPTVVIDKAKYQQTGVLARSLVPAHLVPPQAIGKSFFPLMTAQMTIKAPYVPYHAFQMVKSASSPLPDQFTWQNQSVRINDVQNQGACGSCWAVSSASVIGDQWAVATRQNAVMLSPMNFVNCIPGQDCNVGGNPADAGSFAAQSGIVSEQCWPYTCDCATATTPLAANCTAMSNCDRWYVQPQSINAAVVLQPNVTGQPVSVQQINIPATIQLIQTFIRDHGPVVTGFAVPGDLMDFGHDPNAIFRTKDAKNIVGWHAVAMVGWGHDDQHQLYWILRNSWGPEWGQQGYFKAYGYPLNDIALDVPLFNPPQLARSFFRDNSPAPAGGVTLWLVDTKRSPKKATSRSMFSLTQANRKKVWYLAAIVTLVLVFALIWWRSTRSHPASIRQK